MTTLYEGIRVERQRAARMECIACGKPCPEGVPVSLYDNQTIHGDCLEEPEDPQTLPGADHYAVDLYPDVATNEIGEAI